MMIVKVLLSSLDEACFARLQA